MMYRRIFVCRSAVLSLLPPSAQCIAGWRQTNGCETWWGTRTAETRPAPPERSRRENQLKSLKRRWTFCVLTCRRRRRRREVWKLIGGHKTEMFTVLQEGLFLQACHGGSVPLSLCSLLEWFYLQVLIMRISEEIEFEHNSSNARPLSKADSEMWPEKAQKRGTEEYL